MDLPPIPPWNGMHPQVVHFPIALLLVAPLFLLLAAAHHRGARAWGTAALVLMLLGTVGAYVAVSTGEAGAHLVQQTPQLHEAIEHHEELGETTRTIYTVLTSLLAVVVIASVVLRQRFKRWMSVAAYLVLFVACLPASLWLINTSHHGGLIVHQYGVQANIADDHHHDAPAAADDEDDHSDHDDHDD